MSPKEDDLPTSTLFDLRNADWLLNVQLFRNLSQKDEALRLVESCWLNCLCFASFLCISQFPHPLPLPGYFLYRWTYHRIHQQSNIKYEAVKCLREEGAGLCWSDWCTIPYIVSNYLQTVVWFPDGLGRSRATWTVWESGYTNWSEMRNVRRKPALINIMRRDVLAAGEKVDNCRFSLSRLQNEVKKLTRYRR